MSLSRLNFDAAAFCALPLVRRAYQALVVGLAVFLLTLVVRHEPFRGYLAESQIAGPAMEGVELEEAAAWLKQADPNVAAIASPAGGNSPKSRIRVTYVARLPGPAIKRLDELADRWLYQYLPDRLLAYRRAALAELRTAAAAARDLEDAARNELEALRQTQFARAPHAAAEVLAQSIAEHSLVAVAAAMPRGEDRAKSHEKLEGLRLDLSRLLASFADAHPQVIALRSQIAALERAVGVSSGGRLPPAARSPEIIPPAAGDAQSRIQHALRLTRPAGHFVSAGVPTQPGDRADTSDSGLPAALQAATRELARATRERQAAEQRLTDRMHELSNQPAASEWTAGRALVVMRLGGTPRSSTLALGGFLAGIAGLTMFRVAGRVGQGPKIETTAELASALELPVVGNIVRLRAAALRLPRRLLTPAAMRIILFGAEAVVVIAVAACMVAIAVEPPLLRQVLADPFGTLSEVLGRFGY